MLFVFAYVDIFGFWRAGVSTSRKDEYIGKVDTALLSAPQ
jgi:hypothetical protein